MATNTGKLNLVLPDGSDMVKVGELNGNFQKLDEAYGQLSEEIAGKADIPTKQSTGAQIIVTDAAPQPVVRLVSHIEATQAGEGDPSFDNVRSISGFNTITVANSDSGQTLTADLPETAYDGSLDWGTGAVEDHGTLLTLTGEDGFIPGPLGEYYYGTIAFNSSILKCSHLIAGSQNQGGVAIVSGQLRFYTAAKFPSLAKWKAAVAEQYAAGTPVQVLVHSPYALTMQVEPQIMELQQGANTLQSNSGDIELEYVVDSQITLTATVENAIAPVREQAERNHERLEGVEEDIDKLSKELLTKAPAIECEASGSMVSITDAAAQPAVQLVTHIEPVQEGEGDPSPDNVRPISGWDKLTVTNDTSGQTLTADLPETVYGGELVINLDGSTKLAVEYGGDAVTAGMIREWNPATYAFMIVPSREALFAGATVANFKANVLPTVENAYIWDGSGYGISKQNIGNIGIAVEGIQTLADMQAWVETNGLFVVYKLAEPVTYDLTVEQLTMLKGTNNVWSDCGSTSLVYVADTKLYIDQKLTELQNAILAQGANI